MFDRDELARIEKQKKSWEEGPLRKSLDRFGVDEPPGRFYSPLDLPDHQFLEKVGFPGNYPFTAGNYPTSTPSSPEGESQMARAGGYSGYGAAEDTRDYYVYMASRGRRGGPNIAFDLPTQLGYDSDDPRARGEVGKVGVAIDTFHDFEVIYEAFSGDNDLDKIASNWTINAPANIIIAMYVALAEKRGIDPKKLRGTPQNDILKEFAARGTYIFPPRPSMRMIRDTITYCTEHLPLMNTISLSGYHIREAGATLEQSLAFVLSDGVAYVQLGLDAGLKVEQFIGRFTGHPAESGGLEILREVARARAERRMWAKIMRERFGVEDPRCWWLRGLGNACIGPFVMQAQRPLNNVTRWVLGLVASALSGGDPRAGYPSGGFPYDEPLGLGHSLEAVQLNIDADRIVEFEAQLRDVVDPLAGSYYIESLTDQIEEDTWKIIAEIDALGGAVAAIEKGYIQREIARSAYEYQKEVEAGQRVIVGVNKFTGENELEVLTSRLVGHPYDPEKRKQAEAKQLANLAEVKRGRDEGQVAATLGRLREAARDEGANVIPPLVEALKAYATIGEMCGVLREVFGEYEGYNVAG